jgi:hypothetical protein
MAWHGGVEAEEKALPGALVSMQCRIRRVQRGETGNRDGLGAGRLVETIVTEPATGRGVGPRQSEQISCTRQCGASRGEATLVCDVDPSSLGALHATTSMAARYVDVRGRTMAAAGALLGGWAAGQPGVLAGVSGGADARPREMMMDRGEMTQRAPAQASRSRRGRERQTTPGEGRASWTQGPKDARPRQRWREQAPRRAGRRGGRSEPLAACKPRSGWRRNRSGRRSAGPERAAASPRNLRLFRGRSSGSWRAGELASCGAVNKSPGALPLPLLSCERPHVEP